jgi:hypothetical protein
MSSLVSLVKEAAAGELLHEEAARVEEEVQRFLSEVEQAAVEDTHDDAFLERFMALLKRRGEIARRAMILFREIKERRVLDEPAPAQHDPEALERRSA